MISDQTKFLEPMKYVQNQIFDKVILKVTNFEKKRFETKMFSWLTLICFIKSEFSYICIYHQTQKFEFGGNGYQFVSILSPWTTFWLCFESLDAGKM